MSEPKQEAVSIGELSRQLAKFEERLFGNGQPGVLKELDLRIDATESKWDKLAGAMALAMIFLGVFEWWAHSSK